MPTTIYKPETFLDECLDYQTALNEMQDPIAQDILGKEFGELLFGRANFLGEKRIIIRAKEALVASKAGNVNAIAGETRTAGLATLEFENVVAKGRLGNPEYLRSIKRGGTLALTLYDAQAISLDELVLDLVDAKDDLADNPDLLDNRMPSDRTLRLPIHFPVQAINFVICASGQEPYRHSEHVAQNDSFFLPAFVPQGWTQSV